MRQIAERGKEIFHPLDNAVLVNFFRSQTLETLIRFTQMLFISTIPNIHHTKLHLMVNLMVYMFAILDVIIFSTYMVKLCDV